jgi:hypothetical protein
MPSDEPSRPYNWRPKSLAKLELNISSVVAVIICRSNEHVHYFLKNSAVLHSLN